MDERLENAVAGFEAQFTDVDTEDKVAKADSLITAEIVAVTRRMLDLALYSQNESIALRACTYVMDLRFGNKGKSNMSDEEKAMFEKLGLGDK